MKMNLLVVDDDIVDRESVKRSLYGFDLEHEISEAGSVDEALSLCKANRFDIILLDYRMPQGDGVELVLELGRTGLDRDNVVVMMSNSEDEKLALDCIQAGAQDFLLKKEITPVRLRRTIMQARKRFELERELRESFNRVKMLAERDTLTSLANRYLFEESFKVAIANKQRSKNGILALVLFDVDDFKLINDSFGHTVGDQLLVEMCSRINACLRGNELFARLGGDEFALVLTDLDDIQGAASVMKRIHGCMKTPFLIEGHECGISLSAGISIYDANQQSSSAELLKQADIAMYRSKRRGKGLTSFFEKHLQARVEHRIKIESGLTRAMRNKEFYLVYQPIIDAKSGELSGCETLIRWRAPEGDVAPDQFIPIAEESNKIVDIGRWVIGNAIQQCAKWNEFDKKSLKMSINISAAQLSDDSLLDYIEEQCQKHGVSPENLELELTETALMGHVEKRVEFLSRLRSMGCSVALDDFGTGFSSISHLRNFPIDTVKIDKSVVPEKPIVGDEANLLVGLSQMINTIGLSSVAEGIELEEISVLCEHLGIDRLQGYYFSRPMSAEEFESTYLR